MVEIHKCRVIAKLVDSRIFSSLFKSACFKEIGGKHPEKTKTPFPKYFLLNAFSSAFIPVLHLPSISLSPCLCFCFSLPFSLSSQEVLMDIWKVSGSKRWFKLWREGGTSSYFICDLYWSLFLTDSFVVFVYNYLIIYLLFQGHELNFNLSVHFN